MANTSNHNSGRSWNADRRQRNKNESWEKPMSQRKKRYDVGGGVEEFDGYDKFLDGDSKGEFVGGVGGFVIVDKNGVPDITYQSDINEFGEEDGMMYGLESVMINNGVKFEYPIMDVSKGESIMMTHELKEPYRSAFVMEWLERNGSDNGWGSVDEEKIKKAYEFYNSKEYANGGGVGDKILLSVGSHRARAKMKSAGISYVAKYGLEENTVGKHYYEIDKKDLKNALGITGIKVVNPKGKLGTHKEYANGGGVQGIKMNFKVYADGDYAREEEESKILLLRKYFDFDEVDGKIDYESSLYNTNLKFYNKGEEVMTLKGDYNNDKEELDAIIRIGDSESELNYHPYDGMGGFSSFLLEEQIKNSVKELKTYTAVVSVEGYEKYSEEFNNIDSAKRSIKDIKSNTKFQVVKGGVGEGKLVKDNKVIDTFSKGGGINSGRDLLFKSKEPHEQAYKRKREFKKYGDNGNWFNDFFENGGDIANQNALMVMNDNKQIKHHTEELNKVVDTNTTVPAWIVAKVHRSASDLSDATHYLDGVNTEFKNGGNVSYGDIKKEKERMTDELLKKCGVFFAFSNEQFLANKTPLKEGEKYVSIGGGGYMPKGNIDAFSEGMKSISKLGKKKVKENNLAETEILYELNNHECFYTGDYSDVFDLFKGTYTEEQIRDVYNKHRESNQTFKNGGGVSSDIIFVWAKNKEDRDRFFESVTNLMPDHFIIKQGDLSVQLEVNPSDMSSIEQMAKTYNVEVIIDNGVEPSADYGDLISINIAEKALGRKINSWKDDVITLDGISYRKVFLKPEYKKIK